MKKMFKTLSTTGRVNSITQNDPNIVSDYQKFVIDETKNADITTKVLINNVLVTDTSDYFVFGDLLVNNGVYVKNSYLFKLDQMEKNFKHKMKK